MKEKILNLRAEGKTYNQIVEIVGCSKSTVCYYCGDGQTHKTRMRTKKIYSEKGGLYKKLMGYCSDYGNRKVSRGEKRSRLPFEEVKTKLGSNPTCYLTGESIDLSEIATYSLDHKIPLSKGGQSDIENLGLTTRQANQCKSDLTHEEFIDFCKKVLTHHGFKIN